MKVLRPAIVLGGLVLLAGPALAQERYATVVVRGGYMVAPTGNAADLTSGQSLHPQSSIGGDFAIALSNRIHLGMSFDWARHSVQQPPDGSIIGGAADPKYNVFHTFLKVSFALVDQNHVTVAFNAGPGMIFFSPNDILKAQGAQGDHHFAVNGGATLVWWFSDRIGLVASPQVDVALSKSSGHIFTGKSAVFLPLTGGFIFKI